MHKKKFPHLRFAARLSQVLIGLVVSNAIASADSPGRRPPQPLPPAGDADTRADIENPFVQLVCDPLVQRELALDASQLEAVARAYAKVDSRLWLLRDVTTGPGATERAKLLAAVTAELDPALAGPPRARLEQLVARARGWTGMLLEPTATRLQLTADQRSQIVSVLNRTREELLEAAKVADPAAREKATLESRHREAQDVQRLLTPEQQQALAAAVGKDFDLSQVRPLTFPAPELAEVEVWINSQPLTMEALKGKVVAYHFWAFGCINCVHNLPHYAKWHAELAPRGLVVLGMHTPETQSERDLEALKVKVRDQAILYPVAMDHENRNWAAWANSMWPSVYLVDKRGRVRYWWYGELNWQGAAGEQFMRQKIEQLLAEGG